MTSIVKDVKEIKEHLFNNEPAHFSLKHILTSFFGAVLVGLTFILKGTLIQASINIGLVEITLITATTIIMLTAEIYVIGYKKVKDPSKRRFGQFWIKRLLAYYFIGLIVSSTLVHIYGLHHILMSLENTIKIIIAATLPCSLGAAAADLFEKYR